MSLNAPKAPTIVLDPSQIAKDEPIKPTDEEIAAELAKENARRGRNDFLVQTPATMNTGLNVPTGSY